MKLTMKHLFAKLVLAIAAAVVLSACDDYYGVVTKKEYTPGYVKIVPVMAGKTVMPQKVKVHYPACWRIWVDKRPVIVTQSVHNSLNIGDSVLCTWYGQVSRLPKTF